MVTGGHSEKALAVARGLHTAGKCDLCDDVGRTCPRDNEIAAALESFAADRAGQRLSRAVAGMKYALAADYTDDLRSRIELTLAELCGNCGYSGIGRDPDAYPGEDCPKCGGEIK